MQKVLSTETNEHHPTNTTKLLQQIHQNTTTQIEAYRVNHLITDIISQYKLLMEYLPDTHLELDLIHQQLTRIKSHVEAEITGLNFEFELLKRKLTEIQTPCNCSGGCV